MKKSLLLFAIASVIGNVALVALLCTTPPGGSAAGAGESGAGGSIPAGSSVKSAGANAGIDAKSITDLSATDLPGLVARLRAAGFPPDVVRAIVRAQVNESFSARRKALIGTQPDVPYWQNTQPVDPKTQTALRELAREQTKLMKELLGTAMPVDDPMYAAYLRRQNGNLPPDKAEQVSRVRQDYDDLRGELYAALRNGLTAAGPMTPEDRQKLALLDKEQRADVAKLLSPQELEDYELRTSSTAQQMRYSLDVFQPSEAEFRSIYQLRRAFDEQYSGMMGELSQDQIRQRQDAQKELTAQIKATLSPERAADYERSTDGNFQNLSRIVDRLQLPQDAAVEVWSLQKDIEQRANAVRTDQTLQGPARAEQLAALAQEATTKASNALGPRGLEVYKQYGGSWIQNLQPRQGNPRAGAVIRGGPGG